MTEVKAHTLWPVTAGHTRLLLVRHGETDWNRERRFQGHIDIPLNDQGIKQAQALASRLKELADQTNMQNLFDVCYSSDLSRAHDTAQTLTAGFEAPKVETNLRERNYGELAGRTGNEMSEQFPEAFHGLSNRIPDAPINGGESLSQFNTRILTALNDILGRHPGESILIVAHGGVLDCIYRFCTEHPLEPPRRWLLPNTALNIIDFPELGKPILQLWADVSHTDASDWAKNLDEVDGRVA